MFEVTVFAKEDAKMISYKVLRKSKASAERFVQEESRWENTLRVVCEELGIDVKGDYAAFHGI